MKLEKMNQVSVTEFISTSKEEMYDMAVEMVEKYNRLVDICNDSAERIAELVIERDNLVERHKVYTSALNKDLADKAAKIDLLEKEIEGRKEGYVALKKRMDTDYISIDEHNNICEEFKKKIEKLKKESEKWQDLAKMNRDTICNQYDVCEDFKKKISELEEKVKHQRENLDGINKTLEIRTKENESLIAVRNNLNKEIEAHESENARLSEKIKELKKERDKHIIDRNATIMQLEKQVKFLEEELNKTCTCKELDLKGHNRREMALVNELADKNDEIKKLEESIDYYKNQERIRTDQLRATERKVEELYKQIEGLTNNCRSKSTEMARLRKEMADIKHERSKEDDHGKSGFKKYIEWLIEEEERAVPERFKERLNQEITEIFTKEEETEVNDIPCGSDSIE